jgi:hypothetical protein
MTKSGEKFETSNSAGIRWAAATQQGALDEQGTLWNQGRSLGRSVPGDLTWIDVGGWIGGFLAIPCLRDGILAIRDDQ